MYNSILIYCQLLVYNYNLTCFDVFVHNCTGNPAICPVEQMYSTSEGLAVQLEVYVSGYPQIRGDQITWYRPDMTEILDSDANVQFANIRKTLILNNVLPSDSGSYSAEVAIPIVGVFFSRARTTIDLEVYGECCKWQSVLLYIVSCM